MYALPIENVLEVAELGELAHGSRRRAGLLGVCNFHGQVLPVFDLAYVLGIPHEQATAAPARRRPGRMPAPGFAVDEVTDVAPLEGALEETETEYLAHATLEDGALVGVVDVARVFSRPRAEAA